MEREREKLLELEAKLLHEVDRKDRLKLGELFDKVGLRPENLSRDFTAESYTPSDFENRYGHHVGVM